MPRVTDEYRDARRRAILDAATACFERTGLHRTTTDDIAAEAGISNGALYRYFDGKDAVIEAIAAARHGRERELLDRALGDDDPRRGLRHFLDAYFDWLSEADELRRRRVDVHVWAAALADQRLASVVADGLAPVHDAEQAVADAVRAGRLPAHVDPGSFVRVVLALLQGFVLQAAWNPAIDLAAYARTCDALLDAYLAGRPSPSTATTRAQR